jgi:hypothetical protein
MFMYIYMYMSRNMFVVQECSCAYFLQHFHENILKTNIFTKIFVFRKNGHFCFTKFCEISLFCFLKKTKLPFSFQFNFLAGAAINAAVCLFEIYTFCPCQTISACFPYKQRMPHCANTIKGTGT